VEHSLAACSSPASTGDASAGGGGPQGGLAADTRSCLPSRLPPFKLEVRCWVPSLSRMVVAVSGSGKCWEGVSFKP
jgi:hypothetical protein